MFHVSGDAATLNPMASEIPNVGQEQYGYLVLQLTALSFFGEWNDKRNWLVSSKRMAPPKPTNEMCDVSQSIMNQKDLGRSEKTNAEGNKMQSRYAK